MRLYKFILLSLLIALVAMLPLAWGIQYSVAGLFQRELPFWPIYVGLLVVTFVVGLVTGKVSLSVSRW